MDGTTFLIKVYSAYNEDEEITIKHEFEDDSFKDLEECSDYYFKKYPHNNVSVSPIVNDETIGQILHRVNKEREK